ncbi:MAG: type II secretion system protein GspN [Deltaproteobacteria bacterium]|nr:type II secretion system protein GspN [Deltaproteobacteria bacterium]
MAETGKSRLWLKILGYPLFFIIIFVPSVFLTFPLDRIRARALLEVEKRLNRKIDVASLEATVTGGVRIKDLAIHDKADPNSKVLLEVPGVTARLGLFALITGALQINVEADLFGGGLDCSFTKKGQNQDIIISWSDIPLNKITQFRDYLGVELSGNSQGRAEVKIEKKKISRSSGQLELKVFGAAIQGGKVRGFALPHMVLGDLDWKAKLDKGRLILKNLKAESDDVRFSADGSITLSDRINNSRLNLKTIFSFSDRFLEKNKAIKGGLSLLRRALGKDKSYGYRITGTLRRPIPRPWRR